MLLERHGVTYAEEVGIDLERAGPSGLFRLLCAAVLFAHRIRAGAAVRSAIALAEHGWTTASAMADSTWGERTRVLSSAGFARYDGSTARMLGEDAQMALARYGGDLGNLRERAGHDPVRERALLKEFKGIGDVGADIFLREAQLVWPELMPFADARVLRAAADLRLGESATDLARLADRRQFVRLADALVRADLASDIEDLRTGSPSDRHSERTHARAS